MLWRISFAKIHRGDVKMRAKIDIEAPTKSVALARAITEMGLGWEVWPYKDQETATEMLSAA